MENLAMQIDMEVAKPKSAENEASLYVRRRWRRK